MFSCQLQDSVEVEFSDEPRQIIEPLGQLSKQKADSTKASKGGQKILRTMSMKESSFDGQSLTGRVLTQSHHKRLLQNRQSARRSRNRKRQQLALMEAKKQQLQAELTTLKLQLKESKDTIDRHLAKHNILNSFNLGRRMTFERLQQLTLQDNPDQDQINFLLDTLRSKVGWTSAERQGSFNYLSKQMINICLSTLHRCILWIAEYGIERMLQSQEENTWLKGLKSLINSWSSNQIEQVKQILSVGHETVTEINSMIEMLHQTKLKIENANSQSESSVDFARKIMDSIQCSQLLVFVQKFKYNSKLQEWTQKTLNFLDDPIREPPTIKKIKPN